MSSVDFRTQSNHVLNIQPLPAGFVLISSFLSWKENAVRNEFPLQAQICSGYKDLIQMSKTERSVSSLPSSIHLHSVHREDRQALR